jgi:MFS family permease
MGEGRVGDGMMAGASRRAPPEALDGAAYPGRPYAWTVVAILIATAILSYTDRQVLSLLVDPMRGDLGITDTQISLLLGTAFAGVYGVAGIPLGYLADRVSRRNLILAGIVVWSVGTIGCGLSHDFGQIFASRVVVGLGEAVLSPAAISLISDYFPPSRRGAAVGLFLSGIAIGSGAAILIGGGVLNAVEQGVLTATPLAAWAPWRLVLLLIGGPGLIWSLAILLIREPVRRVAAAPSLSLAPAPRPMAWARVAPIYLMVAMASLVDNAVGAWAPSLLIREFHRDPARIGLELGLLLTLGFGGGVFAGGLLADRAGAAGGWRRKIGVCVIVGLSIPPVSLLLDSADFTIVLLAVPLYFALSGIVTGVGFSTILDVVSNRSRGLAMSISFFLNVAFGAGLGPTAVAMAGTHIFGDAAGLAPALSATVAGGYLIAVAAAWAALAIFRPRPVSAGS